MAPSMEIESAGLSTCLAPPPPAGGLSEAAMGLEYSPARLTKRTRQHPRQEILSQMELLDAGRGWADGGRVIPGECHNISERGMYGTVRVGFGMAIGQEYVFRLSLSEQGPNAGSLQTIARKGVVVRTELLLGDDGDRVGIGVRWCGQRARGSCD